MAKLKKLGGGSVKYSPKPTKSPRTRNPQSGTGAFNSRMVTTFPVPKKKPKR